MSGGRKKEDIDLLGPNVVTLDQDEFNKVCKRVHKMLLTRAEKAHDKKLSKPSDKATEKHIEASKDVFVFVHLMELVESMADEISDLRSIVTSVTSMDGDEEIRESPLSSTPEMFSTNKKKYMN